MLQHLPIHPHLHPHAEPECTLLHEHDLVVSPVVATAANIMPYGWLVDPGSDGVPYDSFKEPHLVLSQPSASRQVPETPTRFYCMSLPPRETMRVCRITHHAKVTQVLAAADNLPWCIALAPPGAPLKSSAEIKAFRINPPAALVLAVGTWHAGPLYKSQVARCFYNLELSDTNVNDRHIRDLHFPHLVPIRVEEEESSQQG